MADIATNAAAPASVHTGAGGITQHSLGDQIKYDQYAAAKSARTSKNRGLIFSKIIPAAAFADQQGNATGTADFSGPGYV